ncbi:EthD family reductase [Burkholderia cepacia]|uniref:EthD family reductase n=1 Tax=Burkholderia cepacia TaxID=292 RepID=UPI000F5E31EE|nr:EthD family reductase [Burkholderia cepacia]MCA8028949.1 EthD family reductase [Burkholderia cepacia]RRA20998.1 EthD family reductase [Burkholderia cepacia]
MHKLVAVYARPKDPAHFRRHLTEIHLPLVAKFPGLVAMRYGLDLKSEGDEGTAFAIVECEFVDEGAMREALASPFGRAAAEDVPNYAEAGVSIWTFSPNSFALTSLSGGNHE